MDAKTRVDLARVKIKNVVDRISALLLISEQNALIVYSPLLAGQIPASRAGHAFNSFQHAMHGYEIVQLCALWDKPDHTLAHNSIPTVHALIDDDNVIDALVSDVSAHWCQRGARVYKDAEKLVDEQTAGAMIEDFNRRQGDKEAAKAKDELSRMREKIPEIVASTTLMSVKNMRDRFLAHALEETFAEKRGQVAPMKYGDERKLLEFTTDAIETLYLWVTGTNFDLAENRRLQAKYARALWENCSFDIDDRS